MNENDKEDAMDIDSDEGGEVEKEDWVQGSKENKIFMFFIYLEHLSYFIDRVKEGLSFQTKFYTNKKTIMLDV